MEEVCRLLHGIAADGGGRDDAASAVSAASAYSCGEDVASDRVRTGMILNDIGVSLSYVGELQGLRGGEGGGLNCMKHLGEVKNVGEGDEGGCATITR